MPAKSEYVIREVNGQKHEELLKKLQLQCLPGDTPAPTFRGWWWIAYKDGEPAGFASLRTLRSDADAGYLERAGVLPAHRGKGLQRKLIRVRLAKARKLGLRTILTTTYDNPPSSNNLIQCGFRLYSPAHPWMCKGTLYWTHKLGVQ